MDKPIIEFETERLAVRPLRAEDRELYMPLRVESSKIRFAYESIKAGRLPVGKYSADSILKRFSLCAGEHLNNAGMALTCGNQWDRT